MNDPALPEDYRDHLAAIVAPCTAPRLSAVSTAKCSFEMTDDELNQVIAKEEAYARGELGSVIRFPARGRGRR